MQNRLRVNQSLSLVGYEPNHDELCVERKGQLSTPSRKKCGHLWRKESLENSQSSRQAETTSTRPEVIDDTRQRRHRQDHEDGHRYCGGNRRHVIDKLGPVDLVRRPTHSTGHVPTEYIRPATIHPKQPPRLHLTAKRRTTFNVQPLRKGRVDHKSLRSDDHRFPLDIGSFHKNLRNPHFFPSVGG